MKTFVGNKIRELRRERKMSQEDVADAVSVTRQTVTRWELGDIQPNADSIKALCDCFGVTADELLNGTPLGTAVESVAVKDEPVVEKVDVIEVPARKKRAGIVLAVIIIATVIFVISSVVCGIAIYIDVNSENSGDIFETTEISQMSWSEIICGCMAGIALIIAISLLIYYVISLKKSKK